MKIEDKIRKIKIDYDVNKLTDLVNEWDPVGLIACGAPEDEYLCLTGVIVSRLYKGFGFEELQSAVSEELSNHFGFIATSHQQQNDLSNYCNKIIEWYSKESCNTNEGVLVRVIVENAINELINSANLHGINIDNLDKFLVEPFRVHIDPDDLENEPYNMWIVFKGFDGFRKGNVVVYDSQYHVWGVAEHYGENRFKLLVAVDTLKDALEEI